MSGSVTLSLDQITAGLSNVSGYDLLAGRFTYSIPTATSSFPGYPLGGLPTSGYAAFDAQQAAQFSAALDVWASYIPETFTQTDDATSPGTVRIAFAAFTGSNAGFEALTYEASGPGANSPQDSDIGSNRSVVGTSTTTVATISCFRTPTRVFSRSSSRPAHASRPTSWSTARYGPTGP